MSGGSVPGSVFSTPTSSGPTSSPTAAITFAWSSSLPQTFALCSSPTITWSYSGPQESLEFLVTSNVSPHTDSGNTVQGGPANIIIASAIDATSQTWNWSPVNISTGQYTLEALGSGVQAISSVFTIIAGEDTSCLTASSSSASTSGAGSTSDTSSATGSSPSPTSSSTALPVHAAASGKSKAGAIAGGVVGGVVIVAAALAAYIFFGLCRRSPTRSRRRAMDGSAPLGKWGGLSSRDSGMDVSAPVVAGKGAVVAALPHKHTRATSESTSANLSPISSTAHGHLSSATTLAGVEEEKAMGYGKGYEYIESVPPLAYKGNRRRSSASTSYQGQLTPIESIPEPNPSAGSQGRARSKSASQSHRALALAKLDGGSESTPVSPRSTRPPAVSRRSIDATPVGIPASPPYEMGFLPSPMNRSSSGAGHSGPRRAARKPVPALSSADTLPSPTSTATPTVPTGASVSRGQSLASTATATSYRAPNEAPAHPMYRNDSQSSTNLRAPAAAPSRSRSREDLEAAGLELPSLNHKSSFGDRPVHYLIPDLPPPPRN
ncbi:hypothetical protein DICSQDRAFT_134123 [Dichomitus squalens LYAD-421 SS1]|uniref:uncharacterized protein n=1 Tax=Dichomitus squalens (strain LYAD-421) TaxID=732165 RepID=UPI0004411033|nr:uncharacterized protein DICSQDRAFT_134123 [Dichomitus squalens LYAD-421 SS1]EJF63562.1 hypothetical protein DICSQDRAFT_134123 [Dichomitus squalens LYAD-421 SS1]